jgi:hypothetical protein
MTDEKKQPHEQESTDPTDSTQPGVASEGETCEDNPNPGGETGGDPQGPGKKPAP